MKKTETLVTGASRLLAGVSAVAVAALLAACTSASPVPNHTPKTSKPVTGVLTGYTGPCGPALTMTRPVAIWVTKDGKTVARQVAHYTRKGDPFRFTLAPGRYTLTKSDNERVVTVRAGHTTRVNLPGLCS